MSININHVERAREAALIRERRNGTGGGINYAKRDSRTARKVPRSELKDQERAHMQWEALDRAENGQSIANYAAILEGFAAKGVPMADILPRENVFTFNAWKAKGRSVKKGEHGVKVITFIVCGDKEPDENGVIGTYRKPHTTTVFHISQTELETEREARRLEAKRNRPVSLEATF